MEKIIVSDNPAVFVHPVEPVNLPKEVARYLEIVFPPITIEPESEKTVFLTFPVEIGIFMAAKNDCQLLDVFNMHPAKYSLYGSPENGVITRYYRSSVSEFCGNPDPTCAWILRLDIRNTSRGWVDISRAVFGSYFMLI